MFDPQLSSDSTHPALPDPFDPRGRTRLDALRLDAGVIHHRLRRIVDEASGGDVPTVEDLDRIAESVAGLHRRILAIAGSSESVALEDVVAARQSIHRSLELVQEVAEEVLAG